MGLPSTTAPPPRHRPRPAFEAPPQAHATAPRTARRSLWAAGVIGVLILGSGFAYRSVSKYLALEPDHVALPVGTLNGVPIELDEWVGRELPIEEAVVKRTDTDDHLSRAYVRRGSTDNVSIFVGYGVRARDLQPHRPDICYPSAGWTMRSAETTHVTLPDGRDIPARLFHFFRGGLESREIAVLGFYIVDGQFSEDVSLLRSKAWRGAGGIRYVSQVQIAMNDGAGRSRRADDVVREFAALLTPQVLKLLPNDPAGSAKQQ